MSIFTLLSKIAKDDLSPRDGEGPVCPLGHLPADLPHVAGPGAREGCGRGGSPQVVGLARALHGHRANAGVPMIGLHGYTMVTISIGANLSDACLSARLLPLPSSLLRLALLN